MGTGYGVIEPGPGGVAVLDSGVIATAADLPLEARVHRIYDGVAVLLDVHAPGVLVLEDLYAEYRFPRTALLMAHARGVVCLAARQRDVLVLALSPAEVKRAIAAHGAASKVQIQHGVQRLLGLAALPRPSHVADALALALTGLSRLSGGPRNGPPPPRRSAAPRPSRGAP
ncbi:MAG TPA: crossover junction endodeoxyribonuclease RuvC, partial [Methylomirabilota bacterium]|nr:crossover junction endodeoxyribonuclease RuvC [Methylomirabilota bacterium]